MAAFYNSICLISYDSFWNPGFLGAPGQAFLAKRIPNLLLGMKSPSSHLKSSVDRWRWWSVC